VEGFPFGFGANALQKFGKHDADEDNRIAAEEVIQRVLFYRGRSIEKGYPIKVSTTTMPKPLVKGLPFVFCAALRRGGVGHRQFAAQRLQLLDLLPSNQFGNGQVNRVGLGFGLRHMKKFGNQFVIQNQGRPHQSTNLP
jgi:hypothetical protein